MVHRENFRGTFKIPAWLLNIAMNPFCATDGF